MLTLTRIAVVTSALVCGGPALVAPPQLIAGQGLLPSGTHAAAATFEARLAAYSALRHSVESAVVAERGDASRHDDAFRTALALALQAARRDAAAGDIICPDTAARLAALIRADFAARTPIDQQAMLVEVPVRPARLNDFYPAEAPLATVPPLLLQQLAPLPPELQYRFLGGALILVDVETRLIVDVLPNAFRRTT